MEKVDRGPWAINPFSAGTDFGSRIKVDSRTEMINIFIVIGDQIILIINWFAPDDLLDTK